MTTDVHAHCIPAEVLATLEGEGGRFGIEIVESEGRRRAVIAGRVTTPPLRPDLVDVQTRLDAMDRTGVDVQLISSWIDLTAYALDEPQAVRYARMFNEGLSRAAADHPDRFVPLCTVPLQAPSAAADELVHAVAELRMAGVEIATTVDGAELDDPALDPFWAAAAELRCLVLLHPYQPLTGRNVSRYFLDNAVGRPAETSIALGHLVLGGVFERFPTLQMCVVHGGGFTPYQAGRLDRAYHAKPEVAGPNVTRPPSEYLRNLYYDTVTHSPDALAFLISFAGIERVVLGTDYPFEMGDADPVATVSAIPGLDEAGRALILSGNVQRLLESIQR